MPPIMELFRAGALRALGAEDDHVFGIARLVGET